MTDWGKFENVDVENLNKDVSELGDGEYPEIPCGKYEVAVDSMELKPTKEKGYPMLAVCFTILEGQFKKQKIFMNQVVLMGDTNDKYRVRTANAFLSSLGSDLKVSFDGIHQYEKLVDDIFTAIDGLEYLLEMKDSKPTKDGRVFKNYKIVEIYE